MSKSIATCTCKKCNTTFTKELYGANRREADSKAAWAESYFDLCPECYKDEQQEKANKLKINLAEPNTDNPFNLIQVVELKGSDKQIRWAEDIRSTLIENLQIQEDGNNKYANEMNRLVEAVEIIGSDEDFGPHFEKAADAIAWLASIESAKWWIEKGDMSLEVSNFDRILSFASTRQDFIAWLGKSDEPETTPEPKENSLVIPENQTTTTEATVRISPKNDEFIDVISDKDDIIISVLKENSFKWYGVDETWSKRFFPSLTSPEDAMAEIANKLLNAGIPVIIKDEDVRVKAINGDYEPTPTRVITAYTDGSGLGIRWQGMNDDIYKDARMIKSSVWDRPNVKVEAKHYLDIEGFAEKWGFVFTPEAQMMIDKAKAEAMTATVKVSKGKEYTPAEFNGEAVLNTEAKVMDKHMLA